MFEQTHHFFPPEKKEGLNLCKRYILMQMPGVSSWIFSRRQSVFCLLSLRTLHMCPMTIDVPRPSVCDLIHFLRMGWRHV